MNLKQLYDKIQETTGLSVITLNSLYAMIDNCFADLTSRGYRDFDEVFFCNKDDIKSLKRTTYSNDEVVAIIDLLKNKYNYSVEIEGWLTNTLTRDVEINKVIDKEMLTAITSVNKYCTNITLPKDVKKILYLKMIRANGLALFSRMYLTNPNVENILIPNTNELRTDFGKLFTNNIFYIKKDIVKIESSEEIKPSNSLYLGFYKKLEKPRVVTTFTEMENVEINIREEFEEALVFYGCYFYYSRFIKDTEKIAFYNNTYKYYIEDILHELNYEDMFQENDSVIITEE